MSANVDKQTGDFKGKQFSEEEVANKVIEQYSEAHARTFYKYVMGGGGYDIHYGIFRKATDGVFESSKQTNAALLQTMDRTRPLNKDSVVLDLGAGHGGLSHEIAKEFGCKVHSFNISPEQNAMNVEEAARLGIGHLITVAAGDFNKADFPPKELAGKFTHVVSCEVFCHAASKHKLLTAVHQMLVPGGALVFTDIMGADGADEKALKDFTDRNATTTMARPAGYMDILRAAGFAHVGFWDGSGHLVHYFAQMLKVCTTQDKEMIADGVPAPYLANWVASLTDRVDIQRAHAVFAWGIFAARKPGPMF
ncbi:S-adenosyl-L-methionine-dependent methyltransferase [Pelagophyceae sp. CCMP2097]|nr:S-adenosyl-L-methionine-dependent methyltransferase [Pelagophyceae sp. CCMP2097]|eukprot:CAMPEP_0184100436 /NCGR_PEP_ID=MMETSP0974-20121125/12331_1 /TAXON_ID=483370 /ORGANISM="non described non described, Strain CCMP2097" /LENGTH=307 /DNA_ID=CAMNT_0026403363 /DNA_START=52 /DNA_END=975 /DNA_ORIENTATION=+